MKQQLIILCGIPFSGKTTLANKMTKILNCARIDLDEVKFKLFGKDITDDEIDQAGWDKIYQQMYKEIEEGLRQGKTVVHDTGNFTVYERGLISDIAKKVNIPFITIFIDTPIKVAKKRLELNRKTKERFDVADKAFQESVDEMEPPIKSENYLLFKNTDDIESWIDKNLVL